MEKNKQIEGLRAMGLIMIIVYHYFYRYEELFGTIGKFSVLKDWGTVGVALFFVISGYFSCNINKHHGVLQLIAKRFLRIYKTYLPVISLVFVVGLLFPVPGRTCSVANFVLNVLMVNGFVGRPYVDGAHWFLTYNLEFTIMAILFCSLFQNKKDRIPFIWLCYIVIMRVVAKAANLFLGGWLLTLITVVSGGKYIILFALGVVFRCLPEKKDSYLPDVLISIILIIQLFWLYDLPQLVFIAFLLLLFCLAAKRKIPILNNRLLVGIGAISFPVYLVHQNLGYTIIFYGSRWTSLNALLFIAISVFNSFALGILLYKYEKHKFNILGYKI